MPDTKTDPLLEVDQPEVKFEEKEDFRELKRLASKMYSYCGNLVEHSAKAKATILEAQQYFYTCYHSCGNRLDHPDRYDTEERMEVYAEFMRGMWTLLANKEKQALDSPADWSLIWELEEICATIYPDDWERRHKV